MKQTDHSKNREKAFHVRAPWQDNILSLTAILSLIVLTLAAVILIFWLFLKTGILSGDIFTPMPNPSGAESQAPSVYDILLPPEEGGGTDDAIVRFSGDFSVLRSLLADSECMDDYMAEYDTVLHASGGDTKTTVRIYVSGTRYRIERRSSGTAASAPEETYICDGKQVAYSGKNRTQIRFFPITEGFDMASLAGIPSVSSYTELDPDLTVTASYAELEGQIVYFVRFYIPDADGNRMMQEYWISPSSELVIRCRTYAGLRANSSVAIAYSCSLKQTRALTDKEKESLFVLPQS